MFELMVGVALAEKQHLPALLFLPSRERAGTLLFQISFMYFCFHSPFLKLENPGLSPSGWQNVFLPMLLRRSELNSELNFMKSYLPALGSEAKKT